MGDYDLHIGIYGDDSNFTSAMSRTRDQVRKTAREVEQSGMSIEQMFNRIKIAAAGALAGFSVKEFASKVVQVRGEFQQLEVAFNTMLGSAEKASSLMQQLTKTAAMTPFDLQGVTQGAKQLLAYGVAAEDVNDTLVHLGDIAAGLSIPLGDLVYLYGTTMTQGRMFTQDLRQFMGRGIPIAEELAKQFGVTKDKVQELVSTGKVGAKEFNQAILSMSTGSGKFAGLMEAQSKTITGQISNIEDAIDVMFNEIGQKSEGIINGTLETVSLLVENYEKVGKVILGVVAAYGAYKAAVLAYIAIQKVHNTWIALEQTAHLQNALATDVEIAAKGRATVATVLFDKAQAALNKTMLANPYVLAGMAIIGLTAIIYKAVTATDEFDDAQERLSEQAQENEASVLKELNRLDELNRKLLECEKGSNEYKNAKQAIIDQFGQYYSGLDAEIEKVGNLSGVYDQLTESIRRSIGARNLKSFYDKEMDNYDKIVSGKLDKAYKSLKDKYGESEGSRLYHNLYSSTILGNKNALSADDIGKLQKTTFWDVRWGKNAKDGLVDFRASLDDLREDIYDTKAASDKALKDYKDMYEITDEQWNEVLFGKKTGGTSPTPGAGTGGKGGKSGGGRDNTAEQEAQQRQRLFEIRQRQREQQAKEESDLESALADLVIASEKDATRREMLQRERDHKERLDAIERQTEEWKKESYEAAKERWEAENKDKTKTFADTEAGKAGWQGQQLNGTQLAIIKAQTEKENIEYARLVQQRYDNERQAALDFLKEYGDYEQQKLAITEEYEKRIAEAATPSEAASLTMKRNEDLEKLGSEKLLDSIDWQGVFNDLSGHTEEYLEGLRDQLQDLLKTGELPVDQMATIQDKVSEINEAINEQGGMFKYASEQQQEHNRRLKEAENAQKLLNAAKEEEARASMEVFTITQQIRDYLTQIGVDSDVDLDDGLIESLGANSEEAKKLADMLKKLRVAQGNYTKAGEESRKKLFNWKKAEDSLNEGWEDAVARVAGNISGWMETYLSDLPDLLSSIGLGGVGEKVSKGMSGISNVAGAAADYASGNYVGAALKAVSAIKDFGSALGIGGGNAAKVAETTERLTKANERLADRISDLTEAIGDSAGNKAINAYELALQAQKEVNRNAMEILEAQMGYHSAHRSNAYYASDTTIRGYNADAQRAFAAAGLKASTITGLSSIYNLTPEQLKAIKDFAPDMWEYLTTVGKYDKSEYWESVVDLAGKTQELTDKINANLTHTSFSDMRNSFLDSLMDMEEDSQSWADNITKIMTEAMVNRFVLDDQFDQWLENWQDRYAEIMKDTSLSEMSREARLADLRKEQKDKMSEMEKTAKDIQDAMGYSDLMKKEEEKAESSFDDLRSSFLDTLMDMNADAKSFRKSLERTLVQDLIEKTVFDIPLTVNGTDFDSFDKYIEDWNRRYLELFSDSSLAEQDRESRLQVLIDELMDERDALDQATSELRERLKDDVAEDTTFKGMADNWTSVLMEMNKTAGDWSENIGKTMAQKIISQMVAPSLMQPLLDEVQRAFNAAMSQEGATWQSVLGDESLNAALTAMKDSYPEIQEVVTDIMGRLGITVEGQAREGFNDLKGTLVSSLLDMEKDAEQFGRDIARTLMEQMLNTLVGNTYKDQMEAVNKRWESVLAGESTETWEDIQRSVEELYATIGSDESVMKLTDGIKKLNEESDDTFKGMSDSFTSALMDMNADAEQFGKEIGETLAQRIVSDMIVARQLQPYLDRIQESFDVAFSVKGSTPSSVIAAMTPSINEATKAFSDMKPVVDGIMESLGLYEHNTQTPFDNLRSSYLSMLSDMESSTEDFAKDIGRMLTEAMIEKFVLGEAFDDKLEEWKARYSQIMESNVDEYERATQMKSLQNSIKEYAEQMKGEANAIHELMGTAEYSDQQASVNMADKATYDQFELFLGMQTAMMIGQEQGNAVRVQILNTLQAMGGITSPNSGLAEQLRNMMMLSNEYLLDIKRSNREILDGFGVKLDSINSKLSRL